MIPAAAASPQAAVGAAVAAAIPDVAFAEQAATRARADSPAGVAVAIPRSADGTVPAAAAAGFEGSREQGETPASVAALALIQADDMDSALTRVAILAAASGETPADQERASTPAQAVPAADAPLLLVAAEGHSAERGFQAAVRARCRDSVQARHLPQVSQFRVSQFRVSPRQDASRARCSARER